MSAIVNVADLELSRLVSYIDLSRSDASGRLSKGVMFDEILLKSEKRPLNLAVNPYYPGHYTAANTDQSDQVRGLERGRLTSSDRRKLFHKFNIDDDMMSASDFGGTRTSQSSASESTGRADSLEGSPVPIPSDTRRNRLRSSASQPKLLGNGGDYHTRSSEVKDVRHLQNGKSYGDSKSPGVFSVTTVSSPRNPRRDAKHGKKSQRSGQQRHGRDQGVSASARRLFSSLRKTGRGRSSSRERSEKPSPTKFGHEPLPNDNLSSDANLPGILKIFGDAVSPGAKYKSVLATRQSKARELVKAALERYAINRSMARKFVLCEVVGRIREESGETDARGSAGVDATFVEDYVRPLNDHEKPLILQSYWKPLEGYARRFELRDRSKVLDQIITEKDRETKDVNAQAKRLIMKNVRLSRTQSSLNIKMLTPDSATSDEDEDSSLYHETVENPTTGDTNRRKLAHEPPPTPPQFADDDKAGNGRSKRDIPLPFLLTLQGEDGVHSGHSPDHDGNLVHHLDTKVTVIGRDQSTLPQPSGDKATGSSKDINIKLAGDDIKTHHCVVYRVKANQDATGSQLSPWNVTLHLVGDDCAVTVNGQTITSDEELRNGDIITIGSKYIFMFKDPTSKDSLHSHMRLPGLNPGSGRLGSISSHGSAFTPVKKRCVDMELSYRHEYADSVLEVIFAAAHDIAANSSSKARPENCERELAPARFLIHCIEQSCFNFTFEQKKSLLFTIVSHLQTILLDATGSVSMQDDNKIKNPQEGINYLLPKLEGVVFWMSNSLEIFSYLQTDIAERISTRVAKEMELNEVDVNLLNDASSFRVTDDVLAILEEIVMYAFQQLVYYLTKTLYGALPKVLDANPFAESNEDDDCPTRGIGLVTAIYEAALALTRKYGVHPAIESQLFAYLFFFTNVSLFNTLMEGDAVNKYYRWDKGVQIRGNLEEIECWANDNGFQEQAITFLEKISALTNLLATTKTQMLQSTWSQFRRDFPSLSPAQLHRILNGYMLGPRIQKRPSEWHPDPAELREAIEQDSLLESYDSHPPLVLPMDGTRIALNVVPQDPWYSAIRDTIIAIGRGHKFESASSPEQWPASSDLDGSDVGERQQPDGHEIPARLHLTHSPLSSSSNSSVHVKHSRRTPPRPERSSNQTDSNHASSKMITGNDSPSSNSVSSVLSDSASQASYSGDKKNVTHSRSAKDNKYNDVVSPRPAARKTAPGIPTPSPRGAKSASEPKGSPTHSKSGRSTTKYATLDRPKRKTKNRQTIRSLTDDQSCDYKSLSTAEAAIEDAVIDIEPPDAFVDAVDISAVSGNEEEPSELRVLPVKTTIMRRSEIEVQRPNGHASSGKNDPSDSPTSEVFIVDVVKGKKGLGLGLVDGMHTSLRTPGVFVRSLVPDGPSVKHAKMKHQEVIKCWLREGRLLLGDRILAVNGATLVSMDYSSAIDELRQAGDHMRFLVGRASADIAMKITSSSC